MQEPITILTIAATCLLGISIVSATILRLWHDWIAYKQSELSHMGHQDALPTNNANARIELADLKERLRKLEAIAAGVDL